MHPKLPGGGGGGPVKTTLPPLMVSAILGVSAVTFFLISCSF